MAETLVAADITNLELTLTVPGAVEVIAKLVKRFGDRTAGRRRHRAGRRRRRRPASPPARRSSSAPALDLPHGRPLPPGGRARCFPGALTPTEIIAAWKGGADMVKVFPCSAVGGASYLKAVKAPLPQIEMVPTGGVSVETAPRSSRPARPRWAWAAIWSTSRPCARGAGRSSPRGRAATSRSSSRRGPVSRSDRRGCGRGWLGRLRRPSQRLIWGGAGRLPAPAQVLCFAAGRAGFRAQAIPLPSAGGQAPGCGSRRAGRWQLAQTAGPLVFPLAANRPFSRRAASSS